MSLANLVGALISLIVLRRRIGSVDGAAVLRSHLRFVAAALGAAAPAWLVSTAVHAVLGDDRLGAVTALLLGGSVMVTMYAGLLKAIHADELDSLLSPLTARLGSGREKGRAGPVGMPCLDERSITVVIQQRPVAGCATANRPLTARRVGSSPRHSMVPPGTRLGCPRGGDELWTASATAPSSPAGTDSWNGLQESASSTRLAGARRDT